ncbi:MAG TPA: porin [Polyangiaceae bacterium]|nr:porin [Polyangiaceae bacterium]
MNGTSKGRVFLALMGLSACALASGRAGAQPPVKAEQSEEEREGKEDRKMEIRLDPLVIAPVVLVQVQAVPYAGDDTFYQAGDMAEQPGFRLRRARIGFSGELYDVAPFEVSADLVTNDSSGASVNDAWIGYRFRPWLEVYAGAHKVPFSRSALMSEGSSALIERSLAVRAMAPRQQMGVHVEGSFYNETLHYYAGVWNGFQRSDQFYEGYNSNATTTGNRFDDLAYSVRFAAEPLGELGAEIADFERSTRLKLGVGVGYFFSDGGTRDIHGGGADLLAHWRGFHFMSEILFSHVDPEDVPTQPTTQVARIKSLAGYGEVGYAVVKSRLAVTARAEWVNPNLDVSSEADALVITGGASYFVVEDLIKAQLEYTHREELGGSSLKNDLVGLQLQLKL